jgi:hypothetical protein
MITGFNTSYANNFLALFVAHISISETVFHC